MIEPPSLLGDKSVALRSETVGQVLTNAARQWPQREALVVRHQDIRLTYEQLNSQVDTLAAAFISIGLQIGDRIGIWAPNRLEWVLTQFASAKAGLILVNINPAYREIELEYALNQVGCRALVTACTFKTSDYVGMLNSLAPELSASAPGELSAARLPHLRFVIQLGTSTDSGFIRFQDLFKFVTESSHAELARIQARANPFDPVNIQFNSGTTGAPKGATLTHYNIVNNGYFVGKSLRLSANDRMCILVPLYHCFGMVMGNLGCVTHGATMVYPNDAFDPGLTLETIAQERLKDLIIRGGENLSPKDIEDYLYRHPKVRTVQVFGVPDHRYGEEVCAWIQLREAQNATGEEIRTYCRGRIAHQKVPRYVRFVSSFPMTTTGKPQKFAMRESMIQELGLTIERSA
jgi:fatty-acyl-CoA synthase